MFTIINFILLFLTLKWIDPLYNLKIRLLGFIWGILKEFIDILILKQVMIVLKRTQKI